MSVTSYSRSRGSSRRGRGGDGEKPWLMPALIGVGALAVVLFLFNAASGGGKTAVKAPTGSAVTGAEIYAPSKEGAAAAATAFEKLFLVADLEDAATARKAVMALVAKSGQVGVGRQLEELFGGQDENPLYSAKAAGVGYVADVVPLKYTIESFGADRASVVVWSWTLSGIEGQAMPRSAYVRDRVGLVREGGTWKVASYEQLPALVPFVSTAQKTTSEKGFYEEDEGGELYEQAP